MIPKIIHYCWFGRNPLPEMAIKCIESWKQFMPEYEIKEWNEDNFDVQAIQYTKDAYESRKFAFVSDYARYWILYRYGGVYFDTDVQMIKPIQDILDKGPFMGHERDSSSIASPGLGMACEPGNVLVGQILSLYKDLIFLNSDGSLNLKSIDKYMTDFLVKKAKPSDDEIQFVDGFYIYPGDFFGPISSVSRRIKITDNTRTVHLYAASWVDKSFLDRIKRLIQNVLPEWVLFKWNQIKR